MNSAEWSWTSCRIDRPALAAATDHNPARFGIQLSCVTPPRFDDADDRICLRMLHVATAPVARRHVIRAEAALPKRPDRRKDLNSWRRALRSGRCRPSKREPCGDDPRWRR